MADPESNLTFLIEQHRELLRLAEQRRSNADTQAATVTAAAVALGALLIAAVTQLDPHGASLIAAGAAAVLLAYAAAAGILVRWSGEWRISKATVFIRRAARKPPNELMRHRENVAAALGEFRRLPPATDGIELRQAALLLWELSAELALRLAERKERIAEVALMCLYLSAPFAAYAAVGAVWPEAG